MTSDCELFIRPAYDDTAARIPGVLLPSGSARYEDFDGPANAECVNLDAIGTPLFRWRRGYPSPALGSPLFEQELKRARRHEIGHAFVNRLRARGIRIDRDYHALRGFSLTVEEWDARYVQSQQYGDSINESLADCFAAALNGEWIQPIGLASSDRFTEGPAHPISPADAFAFFSGYGTLPPLQYRPSPNYTPGRALPIRYIVLHTTEGTDSRSWLTNPASQVSAHYLERDDDEYQLVDEENTAWHAGAIVGTPTTPLYEGELLPNGTWSVNPNDESIGIEMEGYASGDVSPVIIARTASRIRDIRARRGPLPIVSHAELSPGNRSDPGAHNRAAVEALLEEGGLDVSISEERLRQIIREEATVPLSTKIDSGINVTFVVMLRRVARYLKLGWPRDPAGDMTSTPGTVKPYPDDTTPLG